MAEKIKKIAEEKEEEKSIVKKGLIKKEMSVGRVVRIMQTDIPGNKNLYAGLTKLTGVSWSISNALCKICGLDKHKKIEILTKEEIQKIETELKQHNFPTFLLNRRKDFLSGKDDHVLGSNLELTGELDIKRLKKIRSYRGLRHATGQPTRGQRTKSHFRTNRKKGVGIKTKQKIKNGQVENAKT